MEKPKRKYTVTPKVLAANRANLLKANAVPKAYRYRPTRKRLAACYANLLKARKALEAAGEHSPAYGAAFRHGLYCVSLRRSSALAGENVGEFEAHLTLFDRAFDPQDEKEKELVRGIAETAWRRLRVFRAQARWEARSLELRLREAARGGETGGRRDDLACDALERDQALSAEVLGIFSTATDLLGSLHKLNLRLERLCRMFFLWRCPEEPQFQLFSRPRSSEASLLERPGEALSNPFVSPRRIAMTFCEKPLKLMTQELWHWGRGRIRSHAPGPVSDDLPGFGKDLRYGLMRRSLQESLAGDAPAGSPGDQDFQAHLRMFGAAFRCSSLNAEAGSAESSSCSASAGGEQRSTAAELKNPPQRALPRNAEGGAEIRAVAELSWERLQVFRRRAEEETESLKQILVSKLEIRNSEIGSSAPGETTELPMPSLELRTLAKKMLGVFWNVREPMSSAFDLYERLSDAVYKALTKSYGVEQRLDFLKPQPPESEDDMVPIDMLLLPAAAQISFSAWEEKNSPVRQEREDSS